MMEMDTVIIMARIFRMTTVAQPATLLRGEIIPSMDPTNKLKLTTNIKDHIPIIFSEDRLYRGIF